MSCELFSCISSCLRKTPQKLVLCPFQCLAALIVLLGSLSDFSFVLYHFHTVERLPSHPTPSSLSPKCDTIETFLRHSSTAQTSASFGASNGQDRKEASAFRNGWTDRQEIAGAEMKSFYNFHLFSSILSFLPLLCIPSTHWIGATERNRRGKTGINKSGRSMAWHGTARYGSAQEGKRQRTGEHNGVFRAEHQREQQARRVPNSTSTRQDDHFNPRATDWRLRSGTDVWFDGSRANASLCLIFVWVIFLSVAIQFLNSWLRFFNSTSFLACWLAAARASSLKSIEYSSLF